MLIFIFLRQISGLTHSRSFKISTELLLILFICRRRVIGVMTGIFTFTFFFFLIALSLISVIVVYNPVDLFTLFKTDVRTFWCVKYSGMRDDTSSVTKIHNGHIFAKLMFCRDCRLHCMRGNVCLASFAYFSLHT